MLLAKGHPPADSVTHPCLAPLVLANSCLVARSRVAGAFLPIRPSQVAGALLPIHPSQVAGALRPIHPQNVAGALNLSAPISWRFPHVPLAGFCTIYCCLVASRCRVRAGGYCCSSRNVHVIGSVALLPCCNHTPPSFFSPMCKRAEIRVKFDPFQGGFGAGDTRFQAEMIKKRLQVYSQKVYKKRKNTVHESRKSTVCQRENCAELPGSAVCSTRKHARLDFQVQMPT
jgi:hypothetical protein